MLALCAVTARAQHRLTLQIQSATDHTALAGATATITTTNQSAVADSFGIVTFTNLAGGTYHITTSYTGFSEKKIIVTIPQTDSAMRTVLLEEADAGEDEVVVTATRTSRSISDIPSRLETISGEELTEKANMKPGDIRMVLNESTGIQTQQTSATSLNSSIRIQGLDGRYTQVLRDGFPLYAGFSGGLSLMQIAPLDLRQIEVIKGSSSTLYGGGAIAGLVNLVSKTPTEKREISFLANATSARGLDLSGFYSERFKHIGVTIFGSRNTNAAYDPAHIGLTAIPKFSRYTINPRLFFYGNNTTANIGLSYITEDRVGGSLAYINHGAAGYFEKNNTARITTQMDVQHKLGERSTLQFKNSYARFNRRIGIPTYLFDGVQHDSYSELTVNTKREKAFWIAGLNVLTTDFKERAHDTSNVRNYAYNSIGLFVQNTWTPVRNISFESGLRGDYVTGYGFELLPRISALFKLHPKLTARVGGGFGYKAPTLFSEEAEKLQFQNIRPINKPTTVNERSVGSNVDVTYRTKIGAMSVSINQLFFYTRLNRPLVLTQTADSNYNFINAGGFIDTKGLETNVRFIYNNFKLFLGYTFVDLHSHFNSVKTWLPLTPRHRLNNVLMYEQEGQLKIGLEAYYFSRQKLSDGATGKPYWICGAMAEKTWKQFSLFVNFENIFDTRQTAFDSIYTGTINNPTFRDIYAPVDGFMVNGGLKIKL